MTDRLKLGLLAFKINLPARWPMKPCKDLKESGFSGAIVPKKPEDFPFGESDRRVSEGCQPAKGFGDVLRSQDLLLIIRLPLRAAGSNAR